MDASRFEELLLQSTLEKVAKQEGFQQPIFQISAGSSPGDNFVGRIYRVVIKESQNGKSLSLIFKASPEKTLRQKKMSTDRLFRTEKDIYQVVLPTLNKLLQKHGLSSSDTFPATAKCIAAHISSPDSEDGHVLVLEDKSIEGYGLYPNKEKGLDAEHCRLVLKQLAILHSTSMALHYHEPESAKQLAKLIRNEGGGFNNEKSLMFEEMKRGALRTLTNIQETCQIESKFLKQAEKSVQNFSSEVVTSNQPPSDIFCILQGDCWSNNALYKYSQDGSVEDVCLIDLQLARVASPAVELGYFFFLCTTKEVRDANYDNLIKFYHDEVTSNLNKLSCNPRKIIPWELLQEHLRKYGKFGALMALFSLPIIAAESSQIQSNVSREKSDVFINAANVKPQNEILRRAADVIVDACRWNYF